MGMCMDDEFDEAAEYEMSDYDIRLRALRLAISVARPNHNPYNMIAGAEIFYDFLIEGMTSVDED